MINHVKPPAKFIAPPIFLPYGKNGDVHNFHHTPYLPTARSVCVFDYYLWAERLWKLYEHSVVSGAYGKNPSFNQ